MKTQEVKGENWKCESGNCDNTKREPEMNLNRLLKNDNTWRDKKLKKEEKWQMRIMK